MILDRTYEQGKAVRRGQARIAAIAVFFFTLVSFTPAIAQTKGWYREGVNTEKRTRSTPLLANLLGDEKLEILITRFDDELYVYNHDGSLVTGWPRSLLFGAGQTVGDGTISSLAVGDVDGDGDLEIVASGDDNVSLNAKIVVFDTDGTRREFLLNAGASSKGTPCLIDCYQWDNGGLEHPAQEILIRDGNGVLHVLYWTGTQFLDLNDGTATYETISSGGMPDQWGSQAITGSVAARDVGGGLTEIVVGSTDSKVYRWTASSIAGTPWAMSAPQTFAAEGTDLVMFYGSVVLVDLDADGSSEIVAAGTDGKVYVWKSDGSGSFSANWPRTMPQPIFSSPAVADLEGDGIPEIIIGSNDGNVYAWHADGSVVSGWPVATDGDVFGSPVAANLFGGTGLDVAATSLDGKLYVWDQNGVPRPGWPKDLQTALYASPALGDLRHSGRMAVVTSGYNGRVFVFEQRFKSADTEAGWLQFRAGAQRRGAY